MKKNLNILDFESLKKTVGGKKAPAHGLLANDEWVGLVDKAAAGDLDAAFRLAEGYHKGTFGNADEKKAEKWAAYAAKKGHPGALALLDEIRHQ